MNLNPVKIMAIQSWVNVTPIALLALHNLLDGFRYTISHDLLKRGFKR